MAKIVRVTSVIEVDMGKVARLSQLEAQGHTLTKRQDLLGEILAQAPSKEVEKVGFHKQGKEG